MATMIDRLTRVFDWVNGFCYITVGVRCPFCKSKKVYMQGDGRGKFYLRCISCRAESKHRFTHRGTIRQWEKKYK